MKHFGRTVLPTYRRKLGADCDNTVGMNLTAASRKSHCPACGRETDTVSVDAPGMEAQPHPGHLSICRKCGAVRQFTETMELRVLSEEDLQNIKHEKPAMYAHIETVCDAIESAKKFRAPKAATATVH